MSNLTPQMVIDRETGQRCMQVRLGSHCATLSLPEEFNSWPKIRQEIFIETAVTEMTTRLHELRRADQRKLRRKLESDS